MRSTELLLFAARGVTLGLIALAVLVFAFGLRAESSTAINFVNKPYLVGLDTIFFSVFALSALFIFLRKSDNWMALAVSAALVLYGTTGSLGFSILSNQVRNDTLLLLILNFLTSASTASVPILAYLFPDGRFVPRWTKWLALIWVLWAVASVSVPSVNPYSWPITFLYAFLALGLGSAVAAQLYRYRRFSDPEQKQQTKWILLGFVGVSFVYLVLQVIPLIFPFLLEPAYFGTFSLFYFVTFYVSQLLVPLCITFSILRYRLWDIDLIINKSLVYILATGLCLLVLGFADKIAGDLLGSFLSAYVSQFVAALISILALGFAFLPVKKRVEDYVNRKFFGDRLELYRALTGIMVELRPIEDLKQLMNTFLECICSALDITRGEILLRRADGQFETIEARGKENDLSVSDILKPDSPARHLLEKGDSVVASKEKIFPFLVPMSIAPTNSEVEKKNVRKTQNSGSQISRKLIGVLALGQRPGDMGYSSEEKVLLLGLADQVALSVRLLAKTNVENKFY